MKGEFTDYAPQVFNEIRKIFGISKENYASALNPAKIFVKNFNWIILLYREILSVDNFKV